MNPKPHTIDGTCFVPHYQIVNKIEKYKFLKITNILAAAVSDRDAAISDSIPEL